MSSYDPETTGYLCNSDREEASLAQRAYVEDRGPVAQAEAFLAARAQRPADPTCPEATVAVRVRVRPLAKTEAVSLATHELAADWARAGFDGYVLRNGAPEPVVCLGDDSRMEYGFDCLAGLRRLQAALAAQKSRAA